ncbi:hypothetical protein [Paenibacillus sp. DCT19]|uniref:hypothetical protein n=1 Tax=Paenibacillus sp. DCT19 TaxID=2211212 RepID=UPI000FE1FD6A|nr:hypothetical protein [Paenibacillus sp. DCT19]
MNVWVTVKSLGKRKPALAKQATELPETTGTLRQLISNMVTLQIQALEDKKSQVEWLAYLMPEEIESQRAAGKVGFGAINHEGVPELQQAIETAVLAHEDGLYKVFVNEEEVHQLDEPLTLREGDELVFIRFTMLAGRLW